MEQTSISTPIGEEHNETTHCSRQLQSTDRNKEQIVLKLNRLKDKAVSTNRIKVSLVDA